MEYLREENEAALHYVPLFCPFRHQKSLLIAGKAAS